MAIANEDICRCGHTAWSHREHVWQMFTYCREICPCPLFEQEQLLDYLKREHPEKLKVALKRLPVELL